MAYYDSSHKQETHSLKSWFSTGCGEKRWVESYGSIT